MFGGQSQRPNGGTQVPPFLHTSDPLGKHLSKEILVINVFIILDKSNPSSQRIDLTKMYILPISQCCPSYWFEQIQ